MTSEDDLARPRSWPSPADARWLTALAFTVVAIAWTTFADEEPLHIDELRQLRGYEGGPSSWLRTSWGLNQPPLEIALGATWRWMFGATDFAERMLPILIGLAALGLLAYLAKEFAGSGFAPPFTVLAYGLSPIVFATTAFIRPYSLPTFGALVFVISVRKHLATPSRRSLWGASLGGLLLLLTHALVPLLVSAVTLVTLLVRRHVFDVRDAGFRGAWTVVAVTAAGATVMPVILRLKNPLFFDAQTPYGWGRRLTDSIAALTETYQATFGLAGLALIGLMLWAAFRTYRPARGQWWWFVPLAAISPGVSAVFLASVAPGFQFFDRYFHDLLLPGALVVGLIGARLLERAARRDRSRSPAAVGAVVLLTAYFLPTVIDFREEVTEQENTDWAQGTDLVMSHVEPGTTVLFEFLRPFPEYQPLFYGQPRYLPRSYPVRMPRSIVESGHAIGEGPIVVLLAGPTRTAVEPDGWRVIDDGAWRLLIPPSFVATDPAAVLAGLDGEISDDRFDVAIRLALAIQLARDGNASEAQFLLNSISLPDVADPQRKLDLYLESTRSQIERAAQA